MGSGYYPLDPAHDKGGAALRRIADDLQALMDDRGDFGLLPAAYDNDQYDNAAADGQCEQLLYLAIEFIERCLVQRPIAEGDSPSDVSEGVNNE